MSADRPTGEQPGAHRPPRPDLPVVALVVGSLAVLVVRLWAARHADTPQIYADEPAYLAIARLLGRGGTHWNMGSSGTYSAGYSILLSPSYLVTDDPTTIYRAAIVLNAVLGAACVVPLWAIARRVTQLAGATAVAAAVAVLVAPATAGHANWVWAENLTAPAFLVLVLLAMSFADAPSPRRALAVAAMAPLCFLVHSRMLGAALVTVLLIGAMGVRGRLAVRWTVAAVGLVLGGLLAVRRLSAAIHARLWDTLAGTDQVTNSLDQLTKPRAIGASAVGQGWYLLVTTAGLFGLGVFVLVRSLRLRRRPPEDPEPADTDGEPDDGARWTMPRSTAAILAGMVGATAATSVVFMAGRERADHLIYGRYNDAVVLPLVVAGIGVVAHARASRPFARQVLAVVLAMVGAAVYLRRFHAPQLESVFEHATILGLLPLSGFDRIRVLHATGLAVLGLGALVVTSLGAARYAPARPARPAAVVGLLLVASLGTLLAVNGRLRDDPTLPSAPTAAEAIAELVPDGATIRYKTYLPTERGYEASVPMGPFFLYQFYLPDHRFYRETPPTFRREPGSAVPPRTPWFLSIASDEEALAGGARIAYVDPWTDVALWVEPGPEQDRLDRDGRLVGPPVTGTP